MKKALLLLSVLAMNMAFAGHAFALTVAPARMEAAADPGQTAKGIIDVTNEQPTTQTFYVSYENFEALGDSGTPKFTDSKTGLATWFATDPSFTIAPNEHKKIAYEVNVPKDAKPGGYFSAIFFSTEKPNPDKAGEVAIGGKVGVLVLFTVNGDIKESAGLSGFGVAGGKYAFSTLPVNFEYQFHNTGGDHAVPKGNILVQNTFRAETAQLDANPNLGSVLPNSLRKFNVFWGDEKQKGSLSFMEAVKQQWNDFHFGWYTATLDVTWGKATPPLSANVSTHFFIFPWQLLSLIILALVVLKLLLGQYKRNVIKGVQQAQAGQNKK